MGCQAMRGAQGAELDHEGKDTALGGSGATSLSYKAVKL